MKSLGTVGIDQHGRVLADYLVLNSAAILPVLEAAAYRLYRGTAAVVHAVHSRLSTSPPAAQHVAAVYQVHCSAKFAYQGPRRTSSDRMSKSFTKLVRTIVLMKQKASYQVRVYCTTSSLSGKVKLYGCYCPCHLVHEYPNGIYISGPTKPMPGEVTPIARRGIAHQRSKCMRPKKHEASYVGKLSTINHDIGRTNSQRTTLGLKCLKMSSHCCG